MAVNVKVRAGLALTAFVLASCLAACTLLTDFGDVDRDGPAGDFRVDDATSTQVSNPRVAAAPDGSFAVLWTSGGTLRARRYDPAGNAGEVLTIGAQSGVNQSGSSIAMDEQGGFVVVWVAQSTEPTIPSGIYGQQVDAAGEPMTDEPFGVNDDAANQVLLPMVATATAFGFVVAWKEELPNSPYESTVRARRFNPGGVAQGTEITVSAEFAYPCRELSVALAQTSGDFMVVWNHIPNNRFLLQAQRYAGFDDQTQAVAVDADPAGSELYPSVSMDPEGRAVVTWASVQGTSGVYQAQLVNTAGTVEGSPVTLQAEGVNIPGSNAALLDSAGFWAAFECDDDSYLGVCGGRFEAEGNPLVATVLMNGYTSGVQRFGGLALLPNGGVVVVWEVFDQLGAENTGIYGRRFNANGYPISTPD